jgi:hypothetical protein
MTSNGSAVDDAPFVILFNGDIIVVVVLVWFVSIFSQWRILALHMMRRS